MEFTDKLIEVFNILDFEEKKLFLLKISPFAELNSWRLFLLKRFRSLVFYNIILYYILFYFIIFFIFILFHYIFELYKYTIL